jgi:long-subunit fatty acid transport protein
VRGVSQLVGALLLVCASAEAQTGDVFNRTGSGARAAGMANAFTAVSDDGTAASWNPAGLGQLRKPELSLVTTTNRQTYGAAGFRTRDDMAAFGSISSTYTSTFVDFASLAVPFTLGHTPVTLQASWRRLYTLDFRENVSLTREPLSPAGPPLAAFDSNSDLSGGIDVLSFAGAVKLTPRLALGGSFNLWRGDWTEHEATSEVQPGSGDPATFLMSEGSNQVHGTSLVLGLLLTYPRWAVGLSYKGPLDGDFSGSGSTWTSLEPPPPPSALDARIHFPQEVGGGVAWRPATRWTLALDLTWDQWSRTTVEPSDGPPVDLFTGLPPEKSATSDTLSANLGAERLFPAEGHVIPLRFGVAWEPQGPRSPYTRDPVHFVMLAAGTGYNTNSLKFDAAFQYRWAHFQDGANFSLEEADPYLPAAVGERSVKRWTIKLSVIVRVTDTEALHRGLRKIFGGG